MFNTSSKHKKEKLNNVTFHHIAFPKIDPLGDGLREEIIAEQNEPEAMTLDDIDEGTLSSYWQNVEQDIEQDPSWFRFDNEEQQELVELTDQEFDALITRAMNELPQAYIKGLQNVVIVMEDEPSPEQRQKMKLDGKLLLGLYEGVPMTKKGNGFSGMLPDKITLFKNQILATVDNDESLFQQIKRTLWHEIAHYYGLDHGRIHELEDKSRI